MRKIFMVIAVGAVLGALVAPAHAVTIPVNMTLGAGLLGTITAPEGGVTDECTDGRIVTVTEDGLPLVPPTATSDTSGNYDHTATEIPGSTYEASIPTFPAVLYGGGSDVCAAASATYEAPPAG